MYLVPQPYKCVKCAHEFMFSPHDKSFAPITSSDRPVCPKCWDAFLAFIGLGYGTTVWTKDGSEYDQKIKEKNT